jgi:hypothetical protein
MLEFITKLPPIFHSTSQFDIKFLYRRGYIKLKQTKIKLTSQYLVQVPCTRHHQNLFQQFCVTHMDSWTYITLHYALNHVLCAYK